MKKNLFEMGADLGNGWNSDNKNKNKKTEKREILDPSKHKLYFAKEKRRGKTVTIVKPFHLKREEMQSLLKTLKRQLGTGGTIKDDSLEFQGDIAETLRQKLISLGYGMKS